MAENCTLNPDGSLKDASEIPWEYSPSHKCSQLPETRTNGGTSAVLRPGILDLKAPTSATLSGGTAAGLKRKRGEPESHSKLKENGCGSTRIKSLNLGMSGTYEVGFCNPSLTRIILMLEITFAESPGDSEASQSTSVASERAFSSAGLDDDKRRGQIAANTFGILQFVKGHRKEKRRRELVAEKAANITQRMTWTNM